MNHRTLPKSAHPLLRHLRYRLHSRLPRLYPGALCRIASDEAVAITIDDGPSAATRTLLDALRKEDLHVTFFLTGSAALEHPRLVRAMLEAGHAIGTHGHAHDDLSRLEADAVASDIRRSVTALTSAAGRAPELFRPPYGRLNPAHRHIVTECGCRLVLWSSLPGDFDPSVSVAELRQRLDRLRAGDIVVLHDRETTADRTLSCIHHLGSLLRDRGLRTATL
ncbi:MAG: polysaccharide deacetylase family protein [Bacteroidetes bacterium]|nr:polysaccharide deacetylase family protein [Bacteroidota bacterium]